MNLNVQSIRFDADKKLIEFLEKKIPKLEKYFEGIVGADVYLRLNSQPVENKKVEVRLKIPGYDFIFAEREAKSFEEATDLCIDALKAQLTKAKEKMRS
jgi:putative sigma-54 modulation protein